MENLETVSNQKTEPCNTKLRELIRELLEELHLMNIDELDEFRTELTKKLIERKTTGWAVDFCGYMTDLVIVAKAESVGIMSKSSFRHCEMINKLDEDLYKIWEYVKAGYTDAESYMNDQRIELVNLMLDFQNNKQVNYSRYLKIREQMNQALLNLEQVNESVTGGAAV